MDRDTRNGLLFVLAASAGYSLFPIFTRTIYNISDIGEIDLAIWRFTFAIPLMWLGTYLWQRITQPPKLEKPMPRLQLALTGIFAVAAALAGFFGLRFVDIGIYIVLFFTYPVMTAVINTFLGEPLSRRGWLALALTMTGVVLTVVNPQMFSGEGSVLIRPLGIWIAMANALVVALFMIINGRIQRGYPTTARASAWTMTGALFVTVPLAATQGVEIPSTPTLWLIIVGMAAFATVLPYFGLVMGNKLLGANRTSILGTLEPVLAIMLAAIFFGERMSLLQLIGSALIIASIFVLEARIPRRGASKIAQTSTAN